MAGIFEMEMVAALFGLTIAAIFGVNCSVVLCCDNKGACGTIIRGSCVTALGRALSSSFWSFAALHGLSVWAEYVASGLNCADPPSRMCPCVEKPAPVAGSNLGVPVRFARMLESLDTLMSARLAAPDRLQAYSQPWSCAQPCCAMSILRFPAH